MYRKICNNGFTSDLWVQPVNDNEASLLRNDERLIIEPDEVANKKLRLDSSDRVKKRKVAILLGYLGKNYFGMQRNPGMKTIEEDLIQALLKAKLINDEAFEIIQTIQFQRAARTDKGVSAARQVVSLKLPEHGNKDDINSFLPDEIRVFGIKRVTKGFNSKTKCDARTYEYIVPTFAFAPDSLCPNLSKENFDIDEKVEALSTIDGQPFFEYRVSPEIINRVNSVLKLYEGTHNFHNFTSKIKPLDPSASRYIMSFSCSEPFVSRDMEFVTLKVKGQSFILHQIRKMVALAIAVVRNLAPEETVTAAFQQERMDVPVAPSLGLVLNQVHYDKYDKRYGTDGIHEVLEWRELDDEVVKFKEEYILKYIFETERNENSMLKWLATLPLHSYSTREEHGNS
ncbi:pseudouridylate synthase 1 homolog isoform X2 [Athalia rosae]|uniref:pseudouridylate synthase 1 homolog isoform X2 n=1 Tax=Athalia rosae TaxID=37344 RepID=UPI002033A81F|nr:pseudouridylate synthase 1 homolog isoform X2 [Athalia rosae]